MAEKPNEVPSAYDALTEALKYWVQTMPYTMQFPIAWLANAVYSVVSTTGNNIFGFTLLPIFDAIKSLLEQVWNFLAGIVNSIWNAIVAFITNVIVNPLKALIQSALNRLYNKLEGVIFIVVTVPLMVAEAKNIMEKPSLKGILFFALKPILGMVTSKVIGSILKPMLRPVTIAPSTPSTTTLIPPPPEITIPAYDSVTVEDMLTFDIYTMPSYTEIIGIEDYATLETIPPLSGLETITIEDQLTLATYPAIRLTDQITVEDTLIIGVG